MSNPLHSKSLEESQSLQWLSKNASFMRNTTGNLKRRGSFDSFRETIRSPSSLGIEMMQPDVHREVEEEIKVESPFRTEFHSNAFLKDGREMDVMRSPSTLLDLSDNIYRKGKVLIRIANIEAQYILANLLHQTRHGFLSRSLSEFETSFKEREDNEATHCVFPNKIHQSQNQRKDLAKSK